MVTTVERYQATRKFKEPPLPRNLGELIAAQPGIRLAGEIDFGNESQFITSPYVTMPVSPGILNSAISRIALEIPDAKVIQFKPHLSPGWALKTGRIEITPHSILYYPDPRIADLVFRFQKVSHDGPVRVSYAHSSEFIDLMNKVRPADLQEERLERLERIMTRMEEEYQPIHARKETSI